MQPNIYEDTNEIMSIYISWEMGMAPINGMSGNCLASQLYFLPPYERLKKNNLIVQCLGIRCYPISR